MTMTTLEPTTIELLDWQPPCQSSACVSGHPAATHIAIWHMSCSCYEPKLICSDCAQRLERWKRNASSVAWRCMFCSRPFLRSAVDIIEIKPLP